MSFLDLANGTILLIASNLGQKDVRSLLQTNHRLSNVVTSRFYDIALNDPTFKSQFSLETVLQWAAIEGHETPIKQIHDRGGDIMVRNNTGDTLLHLAADNGREGVFKLLLAQGADITAQNRSGSTAVHIAAEKGFDGMIELLQRVWRGPRFDNVVNMVDRAGCTPLHLAAANNYQTIIGILLDEGANIAIKNVREKTALHLAAEKGHELAVRLLMEHGAVADEAAEILDRAGNSPLHSAAKNGYEGVVRVLLEMGVDCTIATKSGATPLHWAAKMGHEAVVKVLLQNEAVVDAKTQDENESTPLQWFAESCCWMARFKGRDPQPILQLLLKGGANVKIADARGKTALHYAVENGEYATRRKEERNTPGRSPKSVGTLNTKEQEMIQAAHQTLIKLLHKNGADINIRDTTGTTPLHSAAAYGDENAVKLLLERGARVEAENYAGKTALEAGSEYPGTTAAANVVRILLENGAKRKDELLSTNSPSPEDTKGPKRLSRIMPAAAAAADKRKSMVTETRPQPLEKPELHFIKSRVTGMFGPASFISRLVHWRRHKA